MTASRCRISTHTIIGPATVFLGIFRLGPRERLDVKVLRVIPIIKYCAVVENPGLGTAPLFIGGMGVVMAGVTSGDLVAIGEINEFEHAPPTHVRERDRIAVAFGTFSKFSGISLVEFVVILGCSILGIQDGQTVECVSNPRGTLPICGMGIVRMAGGTLVRHIEESILAVSTMAGRKTSGDACCGRCSKGCRCNDGETMVTAIRAVSKGLNPTLRVGIAILRIMTVHAGRGIFIDREIVTTRCAVGLNVLRYGLEGGIGIGMDRLPVVVLPRGGVRILGVAAIAGRLGHASQQISAMADRTIGNTLFQHGAAGCSGQDGGAMTGWRFPSDCAMQVRICCVATIARGDLSVAGEVGSMTQDTCVRIQLPIGGNLGLAVIPLPERRVGQRKMTVATSGDLLVSNIRIGRVSLQIRTMALRGAGRCPVFGNRCAVLTPTLPV